MPLPTAIDLLNQVLAMLRKSFPQYARYSRPYIPAGHEQAWRTIKDIATAEESLAHQVSDEILSMGGLTYSGDFPIDFTDTHDLGIDYMIAEAVGYQRQDIAKLEAIIEGLKSTPSAHAVVEEILNVAKRHLKTLEELHAKPGSSTIFGTNGAVSNDAPAANPPSAPTNAS
jgi:bacterioferritin (cytochrome b1)